MKNLLLILIAFFFCKTACADNNASIANTKAGKFKGYIEQTMILPLDDYDHLTRYGVEISFGEKFNNIYVGVGSGMLRWDSYYKKENKVATTIPLFIDVKYLKNTKTAPYVSLKLGGLLNALYGAFVNPSFGLRFKISDNAGVNVGIGYNLTLVHEDYDSRYISREPNTLLHGLNLNVGIDF